MQQNDLPSGEYEKLFRSGLDAVKHVVDSINDYITSAYTEKKLKNVCIGVFFKPNGDIHFQVEEDATNVKEDVQDADQEGSTDQGH